MKTRILVFVPIIAVVMAFVGCRNSSDNANEDCVKNLQILDQTAKSYALDRNLSGPALIKPSDLVGFLRDGREPVCPLKSIPYPPFILSVGPSCPNNSSHTESFQQHRNMK
jgi:hypothetical protein